MRRHDKIFACSLVTFLGVLVACGSSSEGTDGNGADGGPNGDDTPSNVGEGGVNGDDDDDDTVKPGGDAGSDAGSDASASGTPCATGVDCPSKVCDPVNLICLPAGPKDGVQNADETDVDCGGTVADKCDVDKNCNANADCKDSGACTDVGAGKKCQLPSATDTIKNNGESDVDCGGTKAPPCAVDQACVVKNDCATLVCTGGKCATPGIDGEQNGTETDVDCGGPGATPCADGLKCNNDDDCVGKICLDKGAGLRCQAPSDDDGRKNGTETDVDCGGGNKGCAPGLACNVGSDCASLGCNYEGKCAAGRSCTGHYGGDTCGVGGAGGRGAEQWEDCCATADVTSADNGTVHLGKYQVTAGRMRTFLESVNYNVRGFVQQARAEGKIPNLVTGNAANKTHTVLDADWDSHLPTSFNGDTDPAEIADCEQGNWDYTYGTCCQVVEETSAGVCPAGTTYVNDTKNDSGVIRKCHYWELTTPGGAVTGPGTCRGNRTGRYAGTYTAVKRHLGGTIFSRNAQTDTGCFPGSPGTHAFRFSGTAGDTTYVANADNAEHSQSVYDTKALNCVDYLMAQAFCVWDGGRLETYNEWLAASGLSTAATHADPSTDTPPSGATAYNPPWWGEVQLDPKRQVSATYNGNRFPTAWDAKLQASQPACPSPTYKDCTAGFPLYPNAGQTIEFANWRYSYEYPNLVANDYIVFISAPGRTRGRGPLGHADMIGNLFELTSTVTWTAGSVQANGEQRPSASVSTHRWSNNGSWEVHDYDPTTNRNTILVNKYGKLGLRCAYK